MHFRVQYAAACSEWSEQRCLPLVGKKTDHGREIVKGSEGLDAKLHCCDFSLVEILQSLDGQRAPLSNAVTNFSDSSASSGPSFLSQ